ncbi:hypothetical protein ACFQGT_14110 [Natrialbaceae archaeon GCM10025810]|uniref:DUF7504 family protein n=1 Tax=Halovalidus salilacus TaxID=3075124 RepID=UPI003621093B
MVHTWRCWRCEYAVWSASESVTIESGRSHLLAHHRGNLSSEGFRIRWHCPYCERARVSHGRDEAVDAFASHLFDHGDHRLRSGAHVADEFDRTGNVLVLSPLEGAGADNARVHFLSSSDVAIVVTTRVAERVRLVNRRLADRPSQTIVLTTKAEPLEGLAGADVSGTDLELVQLSKRLGLGGIGETISRVVAEHESPEATLSVEFDILPELIAKCDLETVFRFLHLLTSRLEGAGALAHYYCNPERRSQPTINLLSELFDATIRARDDRFELRA